MNLEPEKRERTTTGLPQGAGLAILRAIGHGRRSVGEIVAMTGLAQSNVSNHLARFRQRHWVQVHRNGRTASYAISDAALLAFIERCERSDRDPATPDQEEALREGLESYRRAAMLGRDDLGEGAIDELLDAAVPWQTIYLRVLAPVLRQVGDLWEQGELAIATEHAATAFTQRIMHRLAPRLRLSAGDPLGTLVVTSLEGELHALGAEMAADFFQAAGWQVHYLGPNLPGRELLSVVRSSQPDAVALSVTQDGGEPALRRLVAELLELRAGRSRPILIAGGQWFERHPQHRLPLDIASSDLAHAVVATGRLLRANLAERDPLPGDHRQGREQS